MDRMKAISAILLLSVTLGAGSCARFRQGGTRMFARSGGSDLLCTGLVGWQQIGGQQDTWHFEDGVLYTEGEHGGWLATLRQYDDFKLSLEFRVPPGGNSGVFIRSPLEGDPAYTGMEIQILDDYAEQWQGLNPYQYTGEHLRRAGSLGAGDQGRRQVAEDGHHRPGTADRGRPQRREDHRYERDLLSVQGEHAPRPDA